MPKPITGYLAEATKKKEQEHAKFASLEKVSFGWVFMNRTHCFAHPAQIAMQPPCHQQSSCSITTNE